MTSLASPKYKFINRDWLKIIAMLLMLSDHIWATIIPGNQWMTYIGRMAFPIFAFMIVEGFTYTSDYKKYAQRLLIFALISEIPFNLFYASSMVYPFHQNVLFTLLLGLVAIRAIDSAWRDPSMVGIARAVGITILTVLGGTLGMTDYGGMGVLTVIMFYITGKLPYVWVWRLVGMYLLNIHFFVGEFIPLEKMGRTYEFTTQGFAVLALIPLVLYNGRKGTSSKVFQYSMYIFYPAHMLILYMIFSLMS